MLIKYGEERQAWGDGAKLSFVSPSRLWGIHSINLLVASDSGWRWDRERFGKKISNACSVLEWIEVGLTSRIPLRDVDVNWFTFYVLKWSDFSYSVSASELFRWERRKKGYFKLKIIRKPFQIDFVSHISHTYILRIWIGTTYSPRDSQQQQI